MASGQRLHQRVPEPGGPIDDEFAVLREHEAPRHQIGRRCIYALQVLFAIAIPLFSEIVGGAQKPGDSERILRISIGAAVKPAVCRFGGAGCGLRQARTRTGRQAKQPKIAPGFTWQAPLPRFRALPAGTSRNSC